MARVLVPLPDIDFDTTESAVPWQLLREAGHAVVFATERGTVAACDPLLLSGVIFGQLGADAAAKQCYAAMIASPEFRAPLRWEAVVPGDYDALLLPGGHAPGMRPYLESAALQALAADFAALQRPIAAICHGVLVLARARDAQGCSVLQGRRSTCLPKYMEALAYGLTAWKLGNYFRTYPAYVEDEVRAALGETGEFVRGPLSLISRGSRRSDRGAFIVEDGNLLTARWPGDAWLLGRRLIARLPPA